MTGARTAREHVRRARLGRASQHRPLARDRADRRPAVGHVADRRRVALRWHLWDHYEFTRRPRVPRARIYPLMKGAAQFFLDTLVEEPTHHWLVTIPSLSPENAHPGGASLVRGADDGSADPARPVRQRRSQAARDARRRSATSQQRWTAARARLRAACRSAGRPAAGMAGGLGHARRPSMHHRHVSHLYGLYPGHADHVRADAGSWRPRSSARSRSAATRPPAGPSAGASTSGRACATATTPTRS